MGKNKAFIQVEGVPIVERIYNLFRELFQEVIIVTNDNDKDLFSNFDLGIYSDLIPDKGALGGLYTGIVFSSFYYSFCVACDMPFASATLLGTASDLLEQEQAELKKTIKDSRERLAKLGQNATWEGVKGLTWPPLLRGCQAGRLSPAAREPVISVASVQTGIQHEPLACRSQ